MNSTIPPLHLKECNLCLRDLPLGYFGIKRSNADMYNEMCRECKNYYRRASYYNRLDRLGRSDPGARSRSLQVIPPLKEHNRSVLKSILGSNSHSVSHVLKAHFIKSGAPATVEVEYSPKRERLVIGGDNDKPTTYVSHSTNPEAFVEMAVHILHERRVRLN